MKFAAYVAWILFCKHCKFGEKIYYNSGDIEFFLGDYFFLARPVRATSNAVARKKCCNVDTIECSRYVSWMHQKCLSMTAEMIRITWHRQSGILLPEMSGLRDDKSCDWEYVSNGQYHFHSKDFSSAYWEQLVSNNKLVLN